MFEQSPGQDFGFHPLVWTWFQKEYGSPTQIQSRSWPLIQSGQNVLITAPTGSGKTLTAFLSALNSIIAGSLAVGQMRILYVSPLKALNNDIQRNLLSPLEGLKQSFVQHGLDFPSVQVSVRSGDTPDSERRSMIRNPPEILITTPESLNILLTSPNGKRMFSGLSVVILDEIHAVGATRRGAHLMTAVERLELLAPGFQRIAISATVRPPERIAAFVGGYSLLAQGAAKSYAPRPVAVVQSAETRHYELEVDFTLAARLKGLPESRPDQEWPEDLLFGSVVERLREVIQQNRSTLIFANSRRMAEKISMLINEGQPELMAYCHHGALSREIRSAVETNLKQGKLPAVVATSTLELGIDVGEVDQVVLIQSPGFVSSALQRLGRSGHSVGRSSRGLFLPLHGRDILQSAILSQCIESGQLEEIQPVKGALDVLSQVILSMVSTEPWNPDELFAFLRCSYSYHELTRTQFQSVLEMLGGRFATSRIRELRPRIHLDPIKNELKAAKGAPFLIYMNGGTIPDRGYYSLRHKDTGSRIGELDEEFVWERSTGDVFALGNQSWRIIEINHNDVLVLPAPGASVAMTPFWRADSQDREAFVSEKLATFLENHLDKLKTDSFFQELQKLHLTEGAAEYLQSFLLLQQERTGSELPHRHHLLIEHYEDPMNRSDRKMVILHTLWGGKLNRPFALALRGAFLLEYELKIQAMSDDDCIMLMLPHEFSTGALLELVGTENLEKSLRAVLTSTGFFGALFRQSAGISMLLPGKAKSRTPLWLNRMRAKKLMQATSRFADFPVTLEAWREALSQSFDIPALHSRLAEIQSGQIRVSETVTQNPSPFARNLIWQQINTFMYQDDRPESDSGSQPGEDFFRDLARSAGLRPAIPFTVLRHYRDRMMRTAPGYEPDNVDELLELIRDRVLLHPDEWRTYLQILESMQQEQVPSAKPRLQTKISRARKGLATGESREVSSGEADSRENAESESTEATESGPSPERTFLEQHVVVIRAPEYEALVCALETVPLLERALPSIRWQILPIGSLGTSVDAVPDSGVGASTSQSRHAVGTRTDGSGQTTLSEPMEDALARLRKESSRISFETESSSGTLSPGQAHPSLEEASEEIQEPGEVLSDLIQSFLRFHGIEQRQWLSQFFPDRIAVDSVLNRWLEEGKLLQGQLLEAGEAFAEAGPPINRGNDSVSSSGERASGNMTANVPANVPASPAANMTANPAADSLRGPGIDGTEICEAETMEILLRLTRSHLRPDFEPLDGKYLPLFLADFQGLARRGAELDDLKSVMEQLIAYPLKASLWETEVLPARLQPYYPAWLDSLAEYGLFWFGCGKETVTYLMERDLDLLEPDRFRPPDAADLDQADAIFPSRTSRFGFFDLLPSGADAQSLNANLWHLAWKGLITNDSMNSLRKGIDNRFQVPDLGGPSAGGQARGAVNRLRPVSRSRWSGSLPPGQWRRLEFHDPDDVLEKEQWNRERVHILLGRYGILFRELLQRELPEFQWKNLYNTLRRMELSGEVMGGFFFDGIPSLQFISPAAFRHLGQGLPEDAIYWMNAQDPASLCGTGLEVAQSLPRRVPGNHIVYSGYEPVLLSTRKGKELQIQVPASHPELHRYLDLFAELLSRQRLPVSRIEVERINGQKALESDYKETLLSYGFYSGNRSLVLHKKYN